jgi:hypothetical protein
MDQYNGGGKDPFPNAPWWKDLLAVAWPLLIAALVIVMMFVWPWTVGG